MSCQNNESFIYIKVINERIQESMKCRYILMLVHVNRMCIFFKDTNSYLDCFYIIACSKGKGYE